VLWLTRGARQVSRVSGTGLDVRDGVGQGRCAAECQHANVRLLVPRHKAPGRRRAQLERGRKR
jgi:hypothetical protein